MRIALVIMLATALSGCGSSRIDDLEAQNEDLTAQTEDLRSQVAALEAQLEELDEHLSDLEAAQADLSNAVDRFDFEDWRDVVPDVRNAAEEVELSTSALRSAL